MKEKETREEQKGITLIALVVTIVVLLILAGTSIAMLSGDNGIITNTEDARNKNIEGQEKEQIQLAYDAVIIDNYESGDYTSGVTASKLEEQLNKQKAGATVTGDSTTITVTFESGNSYTVDGKTGEITGPTAGDPVKTGAITINEFSINGTDVTTPPIPKGFYHVGGTINDGYVISDSEEDNGKGVNANLVGNQFVWVPVKQNQKITLKVTSEEDITSIVVTDPYGDDIVTIADENVEKSYSNEEIKPTINGPYRVIISTNSGLEVKYLNVHSLYAVSTFLDLAYPEILKQLEGNYNSIEDFNEKYQENFLKIYIEKRLEMTVEEVEQILESQGMDKEQFIEMILQDLGGMSPELYTVLDMGGCVKDFYEEPEDYTEEVNIKGGYYVGRYEVGKTEETEIFVAQKDKDVYDWITQTDALSKAKEYAESLETNVTSSLLTGAAWDRLLEWLYETKNKTGEQIALDSTSWGNYSNNEFSGTDTFTKTGQCKETEANHIYDIAGNHEEWTSESALSNGRAMFVRRGGNWGSLAPAIDRVPSTSAGKDGMSRFPSSFIFLRLISRDSTKLVHANEID